MCFKWIKISVTFKKTECYPVFEQYHSACSFFSIRFEPLLNLFCSFGSFQSADWYLIRSHQRHHCSSAKIYFVLLCWKFFMYYERQLKACLSRNSGGCDFQRTVSSSLLLPWDLILANLWYSSLPCQVSHPHLQYLGVSF